MNQKKENKKVFNLKKAQEAMPPMDDMGLIDEPELREEDALMEEELYDLGEGDLGGGMVDESPTFQDGGDLRDWLDSKDSIDAINTLIQYIPESERDIQQMVSDSLHSYYEGDLDSNQKHLLAGQVFDMLPQRLKATDPHDLGSIEAPYGPPEDIDIEDIDIESSVKKTNDIIRKLAIDTVSKKQNKKSNNKSFNLKKTAQHQSVDNVILHGPEGLRIDPFYRMPVNDWHIVERNKGWGQDIGGRWDIDYETIWRNHIMDKYSRPYKNKEGKWVGGYLNKRFEIDSNVPDTNNYQLKPGERRKPILPQYGNLGARLEYARESGDVTGEPVVEGKVFNWKEAKKKS